MQYQDDIFYRAMLLGVSPRYSIHSVGFHVCCPWDTFTLAMNVSVGCIGWSVLLPVFLRTFPVFFRAIGHALAVIYHVSPRKYLFIRLRRDVKAWCRRYFSVTKRLAECRSEFSQFLKICFVYTLAWLLLFPSGKYWYLARALCEMTRFDPSLKWLAGDFAVRLCGNSETDGIHDSN